MLSSEQLAMLASMRETVEERSWVESAETDVAALPTVLADLRCSATRRNMTSLDELGADALTKDVVVSFCTKHALFHLYTASKALNGASNLAVAAQSKIDLAAEELGLEATKRLRGRVMYAREQFYKAVQADVAAMDKYRRFGLFKPETVKPRTIPVRSITAVKLPHQVAASKPVHVSSHTPVEVRREQARRVWEEIGITDSQLIQWYRCYRKKPYTSVAAAINSTMLVHEQFERMTVYLCGHCTNLHIGHRSQQGEAITPAFFTRAIAKWHEMPESAERYMAEQGIKRG